MYENMKNMSENSFTYDQAGFTYKLTRIWSRYVFVYYIPSTLCVLASWISFFVKPEESILLVQVRGVRKHSWQLLTLTFALSSFFFSSGYPGS